MSKNSLLITLCCIATTCTLFAQSNSTNSPFSRYGLGLISDNSFSMCKAMGGVGIGMRTNQQINGANPAAYSAMDSLTFLMDLGVNIQPTWTRENIGNIKETTYSGGFEYLAIQFPVTKYMAVGLGLLPFTSVGYSFGTSTGSIVESFTGAGGFNQLYLGLAATPFKGFSLGIKAAYLFGSITYINNLGFSSGSEKPSSENTILRTNTIRPQLGAQYNFTFNTDKNITIGATYTPTQSLRGSQQSFLRTSTTYDIITENKLQDHYDLPTELGFGISYNQTKKLMIAADVSMSNWAKTKYAGVKDSLNNSLKISLGAEYIPNIMERNYLKRMRYRAGAFYNKSYIKINGADINEIGISAGLAFPLRNNKSLLSLTAEYVSQLPTKQITIQQNYLRLSVSLTFNEMWFHQFKLQ